MQLIRVVSNFRAPDSPGRRPHAGPAGPCPHSSALRLPVRPDRTIQRVRRAAGQHLPSAANRAPGAAPGGETVVAAIGPRQLKLSPWCLETQAWQVLTAGDYQRAADISQAAQRIAPKAGSAFIQATAQEGRAWARLGAAAETRAALSRVEALVSPLPIPERPEHHYRYDPPKAQVYVATTLSWLGDKAAEGLARQVLAAIEAPEIRPRPRRAALARLDLALALTAANKHDEAAGVTLEAIRSGRLAPVDGRRAREIVLAVAERQLSLAGRGRPRRRAAAEILPMPARLRHLSSGPLRGRAIAPVRHGYAVPAGRGCPLPQFANGHERHAPRHSGQSRGQRVTELALTEACQAQMRRPTGGRPRWHRRWRGR
jgi:hypothetical protein